MLTIFLLMLSSAVLGFLFSWIARRDFFTRINEEKEELESRLIKQKEANTNLEVYIISLQGEKKNLLASVDDHLLKIEEQELSLNQFKENKEFLYSEFSNYYTNSKQAEKTITSQNVEMEAIKEDLKKLKKERELWEEKCKKLIKHYEGKDFSGEDFQVEKEAKPGESVGEKESTKKLNKLKKLEAELKAKKQAFKKLKEEHKELFEKFEVMNQDENLLLKIQARKRKVDFDRIGHSKEKAKEDLKKLDGIGPFIEQKLNALGIFRFEQIANFNDADIELISALIELSPDLIQKNHWVDHSRKMK